MFIESRTRVVNKFNHLKQNNCNRKNDNNKTTNHVKNPVINLASPELPKNHENLLYLGPNFVPTSKRIPFMDIISTSECSALKLEYSNKTEIAQTLRKDVLKVLKTSKPPRDNLSRDQRLALKEIRSDNDIAIYPFDKGSGLVRISNIDANRKIIEQMGNVTVLTEDPTPAFAIKVRNTLCKLNKRKRFSKSEYELVYPSDAIPPRMYGSVKAHKPEKNYPMRNIVSTIGTPVHGLSQYLVKIIQPTLDKNEIRLKNADAFVQRAKNWDISQSEVQVSYDVVNLYPSVPVDEAIVIMVDTLRSDHSVKQRCKLTINEMKELIELCLSKCYFLWNDTFYEMKNSGPIGLSLMVVISESFLQCKEKQAMQDALTITPPLDLKSFYRYVDDSHARFPDFGQSDTFLEILNKQSDKVQYTIEREDENKSLNFIGLHVVNNLQGKYNFNIHRKDAITNIQIKPQSSHDPKILDGVFKGFVQRALSLCSEQYIASEIEFLVEVFIENGYDSARLRRIAAELQDSHDTVSTLTTNAESTQVDAPTPVVAEEDADESQQTITLPWIPQVSPKLRKVYKKAGYKVVFKSGMSLKRLLTSRNKSRLPPNSHPGVYKVKCDCTTQPYIGETKLRICTRTDQHKEYVAKKKHGQSGISNHAILNNCVPDWDNTETLKIEPKRFERKVREALEIQRWRCGPTSGGLNLDDGQYVTTKFWTPMFHYLRENQLG